jgi:hypothetical protein
MPWIELGFLLTGKRFEKEGALFETLLLAGIARHLEGNEDS